MNLKKDKADREQVPKCQQSQSPKDGGGQLCQIDHIVSKELIFVKMKEENKGCPYSMSYGYSHICKWPQRHELYLKSEDA